jgi:hypothetical protein
MYHAVKDWLKHRLGLEINEEKSQIVNLKKRYSEFLGFKLKLSKRGKKSNDEPKYIVKSHITEKSMQKIVHKAHLLIRDIEFHNNDKDGQYAATSMYNSFVIGAHNYYNKATNVQKDFRKIAFPIYKSLKARLRERLKTRQTLDKKQIHYTIPKHIQQEYGRSAQLRFIGTDKVLVPMGFVSHKSPMMKAKVVNKYTQEGRAFIHKGLERIDKNILHYLMRNPVHQQSIEFNDNRLSLYCAQLGRCAISRQVLEKNDIHCHHIVPRHVGGTDEYDNLVIVSGRMHQLIHANKPDIVMIMLSEFGLSPAQVRKLNKYRKLAIVDNCFVIPECVPDGTRYEGKLSRTV